MNVPISVIVNDHPVPVKEWNGKRVVTFKDIDTVHSRADGTARRNFNKHKERFIEGEDFCKITPNEFRTAIGSMDDRQTNDITLITESGYLMLVKSFTDDLAWHVQRQLVNNYFRIPSSHPEVENLSPQLQYLIQMEQRQNQLEQRQTELEQKLEADRDAYVKAAFEFGRIGALQRSEIQKAVKVRAINLCEYAETYDKVGKRVISSIYKALQKKFGVDSYVDLQYQQYTDALIFIQCWEPTKELYDAVRKTFPKVNFDLFGMLTGV